MLTDDIELAIKVLTEEWIKLLVQVAALLNHYINTATKFMHQ